MIEKIGYEFNGLILGREFRFLGSKFKIVVFDKNNSCTPMAAVEIYNHSLNGLSVENIFSYTKIYLAGYEKSSFMWFTPEDIKRFEYCDETTEDSLSMYHIKDVLKDVLFIIGNESVTFSSLSVDLINECIKTLEKEGY